MKSLSEVEISWASNKTELNNLICSRLCLQQATWATKIQSKPETLLLLRSTLMFSYLCVGLPSVLLFSTKLKSCILVSCLTNASCLCLSHLHSLQLISNSLQSTNHEVPHYTFTSILLSLPPSWAQTLSAATYSILTVYVLSFEWKVILHSFGVGTKNSNWYDVTAARDTNLCTARINSWVSQSHIMTMSCQCK